VQVIADDRDTGRRRVIDVSVADETDVDNPTGFAPLSTVAPLAVAQAAGSAMRSAPGRMTGSMCMRITFSERPTRPARFCNRYLSTAITDPQAGLLGSAVVFGAAIDALDAVSLIETFEGRPPHVAKLEAALELRRGERLAILRRVRAPRRVRAGRTVPLRVSLQRVRGGRVTRTHRVRIPGGTRPGLRTLTLVGPRQRSPDEGLIEILLGEDGGGQEETSGPATLADLTRSIRELRRWDGVRMRLGGDRRRAFRDDRLVIAGRVSTPLRVVR
jgi:hypothetical protein